MIPTQNKFSFIPSDILDKAQSIINREIGIKRAIDNAEKKNILWKEYALEFVKEYPSIKFMVEDVRVWAYKNGLPKPPHGRAWGAVIREAVKDGTVRHCGFSNVKNPKAHRTPASVWIKED